MNLLNLIEGENFTEIIGDRYKQIKNVVSIFDGPFDKNTLTWVNDKNIELASRVASGTIICGLRPTNINSEVTYLISSNPRTSFKNLLDKLHPAEKISGVEKTAHIDPSAVIGENSYIGQNVIIEKNCKVGRDVKIGHNSVIKSGTIIGNQVVIGSNCTIGGVGFGYQKNESGEYELIKHVGIVRIGDKVEVGNNTCIDRAVLGETSIGENVKIDNLVHIAHNVKIQPNALIIANAMVAGSCEIGSNTWVAPSSNIINGIRIGSNVTIGIGAVVLKPVEDGKIVVGNPAKELVKK